MMKKFLALLLAALLFLLPALAAAETAVASFYPIYLFARNLTEGIEDVEIISLTTNDVGCLHDYQLQTSDMKALARADVFLINGAGMEGYLTMVYDALPALPVIDASQGVAFLCADDVHAVASDDHHHDHSHEHEEINAHIWLDVENAKTMVVNLCEGMATAWPHHRAALESNRDAYLDRLTALDAELEAMLAPVAGKPIITFHEAFPYFAQAYGVSIAGVISREPGDALSPAQLAELVLSMRDMGNPPLFIEPQYDDIAAMTLAAETGAAVYVLDPIVTGPVGDDALTFYEQMMRRNAETLVEALGN